MEDTPLSEEILSWMKQSIQMIRNELKRKISILENHLRALDENELYYEREIPKNTQQVFDILLSIWSHEFPGRKFWILSVKSGIPHTWSRDTIEIGKEKFIHHRTWSLLPPDLDRYPYRHIKTKMEGYESHIIEIQNWGPSWAWHRPIELVEHTRWKDAFIYLW